MEGGVWRLNVFQAGIGRCHDAENIDFIKHKAGTRDTMRLIYTKFGILNIFSPHRPDGSYMLNLAVFEERIVAKALCELAKTEGLAFMTDIKLNGKGVEKLTPDFIRSLPEKGCLDLRYRCPEEKVKLEQRDKIGEKYLEW